MIVDYVFMLSWSFEFVLFFWKIPIFLITQYLISHIGFLPFPAWHSTAPWIGCLQHWLWTLYPLWGFDSVTKQQLKKNIKLPVILVLSECCLSLHLTFWSGYEISLPHNKQSYNRKSLWPQTTQTGRQNISCFPQSRSWQGLLFQKSWVINLNIQTQQLSTPFQTT